MAKFLSCNFSNIEEGMKKLEDLWTEYNSLVPTYKKLISIKKELKLPLNGIRKSFLKEEFPDIDFLKIKTLDKAIDFMYDLTPRQISSLINRIEYEKENGVFYKMLRSYIRDFRFEIRRVGKGETFYQQLDEEKNNYALMLLSSIEES